MFHMLHVPVLHEQLDVCKTHFIHTELLEMYKNMLKVVLCSMYSRVVMKFLIFLFTDMLQCH